MVGEWWLRVVQISGLMVGLRVDQWLVNGWFMDGSWLVNGW